MCAWIHKFCMGHVSAYVKGVCVHACVRVAYLLWQQFLFAFECQEGGAKMESVTTEKGLEIEGKERLEW